MTVSFLILERICEVASTTPGLGKRRVKNV
jgi:hypothetical protein